jgi:hypothetical protein
MVNKSTKGGRAGTQPPPVGARIVTQFSGFEDVARMSQAGGILHHAAREAID